MFTSTSRRPKRATQPRDGGLDLRRVADVAAHASARPRRRCGAALAVSSRPSAERSTQQTLAPSDARRSAVAWPMPAAAPVTSATLPSNRRTAPLRSLRLAAVASAASGAAVSLGLRPAVVGLAARAPLDRGRGTRTPSGACSAPGAAPPPSRSSGSASRARPRGAATMATTSWPQRSLGRPATTRVVDGRVLLQRVLDLLGEDLLAAGVDRDRVAAEHLDRAVARGSARGRPAPTSARPRSPGRCARSSRASPR